MARRSGSRRRSRRGSRPTSTRCSATRRRAPTATPSTSRRPGAGRRARRSRASGRGSGRRSTGSPRRPRRTTGSCRTSRRAGSGPAPRSTCSPVRSPSTRSRWTVRSVARRSGFGLPRSSTCSRARSTRRSSTGCRDPSRRLSRYDPPPMTTAPAIRVRIAPSPTGPLHIGIARTALFNYLFARRNGGTFVLRLEDTDVARSSIAYEKDILDGLHWLGIHWDEGPDVAGGADLGSYGPYRQMQRLPRYAEAAARLVADDLAYPCFCTPEELEADRKAQEAAHQPPRYVGRCAGLGPAERAARESEGRRGALRFRVGEGVVGFDDIIRGRVEIDVANLGGDFVIVRADGTPLYHFTV